VWAGMALLLIGLSAGYLQLRQTRALRRVFVIGWEPSPPNQIAGPNGEATGYAVELVREAARRRGIRLRWKEYPHETDQALEEHWVDLWLRMTITPERQRRFYLTTPIQEHNFGFLVLANSLYFQAEDLKNVRVAYDGMPISANLLHEEFPQAELVSSQGLRDAVPRLCRGDVPAVFGERFTAFSMLIENNPCPGTILRVIPIVALRTLVAMGAVRDGDAPIAARAISTEIDRMVDDGSAARIANFWGYPASQDLLFLTRLRETRRTLWRYKLGLAAIGGVCLLALWAAIAYRRARDQAQATGRALRETERNLRLLASSLSEMVLAFDRERHLTYANPGAQQLTGYSPDELRVAEFACWVHPEDRDTVLAGWDRAYRGEHVKNVTYRLRTRSGETRWVSANWNPTCDETGQQIGVQASERDISEQVRAEQERAALEAQLLQSQKLESVGRLAGGIAHDFNNMLTVIQGFACLLLKGTADSKSQERANEIVKAANHAAELTSQLLAFSRKQMVKPQRIDINELIADCATLLRRLIGEDVELRTVLEPAPFPIRADPGQLRQVFINLAANARDAMPGTGWLLLETSNVTLDENYAATHAEVKPGDYLQITVTDSGSGMDQDTLNRIFEPFFTTKAAGKGTGLGLATVYGIVKQAGGHISAHSEPGNGTCFKMCFPRNETAPPEETAPEAGKATLARGETIMVVEDQDEVRAFIVELLREEGYRVLEAESGAAGLALAREHPGPIALLLTDVVMPNMNGKQLADQMLKLRPQIKVLFMSGYTQDLVAHHGILDPGIHFISKPFAAAALQECLRRLLEQPD